MDKLTLYISTFIFVYAAYYFFSIKNEKKLTKFMKGAEIGYLKSKYKLDIKQIGSNKLSMLVALANTFIISNTALLVSIMDEYTSTTIAILISPIIIVPMTALVYRMLGNYLSKKEVK
jgi:hypothetical protein